MGLHLAVIGRGRTSGGGGVGWLGLTSPPPPAKKSIGRSAMGQQPPLGLVAAQGTAIRVKLPHFLGPLVDFFFWIFKKGDKKDQKGIFLMVPFQRRIIYYQFLTYVSMFLFIYLFFYHFCLHR